MSGILTAIASGQYGGTAGVTYFFSERFEGTGYQNTWTESGTGTINEDYTTSPMEGAQCLRLAMSANTGTTTSTFVSDQPELWGFFRFRINVSTGTNRAIFLLRNSSATTVFAITLNTDNGIQVGNGTQTSVVTPDKMTTGTDYYLWWHFLKGSGANGVATASFGATGTEVTSGNAFKTVTNSNTTTDAHDIRLGNSTSTTYEAVFDHILISTTGTIGNSPA